MSERIQPGVMLRRCIDMVNAYGLKTLPYERQTSWLDRRTVINGCFSRCILPCHPLSQRPARSYFGLTGGMQSGASNTLSAEASKERFIVKVIVDVLTILITLYKIMNLLQILYFFLLFALFSSCSRTSNCLFQKCS